MQGLAKSKMLTVLDNLPKLEKVNGSTVRECCYTSLTRRVDHYSEGS